VMKFIIGLLSVWMLCCTLKGERFAIEGNSMYPNICNGDLVYVQHKNFDAVKVNDVVVFSATCNGDNMVVCHRVVSRNYIFLNTCGDNNMYKDNFVVTKENFIGKIKN